MFKKCFLTGCFFLVMTFGLRAQNQTASDPAGSDGYKNSVGLALDFGSTIVTGAGVGGKHFFTDHDAAEVNLLFYNDAFSLGAYYEYHGRIQNAAGLKWYFGLGPQLFFGNQSTAFAARALAGLDYKIPNVPLNFAFDWRPLVSITGGAEFMAARFGLGVRFAF